MRYPRIFCYCLILLLTACASQPLTPIDNLKRYQTRLAAEKQWQVTGKIVVRANGEAEKARVNWQNDGAEYKIRFSGTLGMGTTYLYGNAREVRLEQGGKAPVTAATPEQLVYEQMGQDIPVSNLRYWVRGLPAPNTKVDHINLGEDGTLQNLQQNGWTLTYSGYTAVGPWNLPGRLMASRDDIELTIDVSKWEYPAVKHQPDTITASTPL